MADLKAVAKSYNMNVNQLAEAVGYTRQNLHKVMNQDHAVGTNRMYATLKLLKHESDKLNEEELAKALESKRERERHIAELANTCGLIWRVED